MKSELTDYLREFASEGKVCLPNVYFVGIKSTVCCINYFN